MSMDAVQYYRRRVIEERERAAKSTSSEVANVHQEFARHYEARLVRAEIELAAGQ